MITLFELRRDGRYIMIGTEYECMNYIHRNHSYSMDHALRYEGYTIH